MALQHGVDIKKNKITSFLCFLVKKICVGFGGKSMTKDCLCWSLVFTQNSLAYEKQREPVFKVVNYNTCYFDLGGPHYPEKISGSNNIIIQFPKQALILLVIMLNLHQFIMQICPICTKKIFSSPLQKIGANKVP